MSDETDPFGRPAGPERTDPFGNPVQEESSVRGWAPPVAPQTEPEARWQPPVSPSAPPGVPSGWWRRVGATIVDGLLVGIAGTIVSAAIVSAADTSENATTALGALVGIVLAIAYYGVLMSRPGALNGQTLGKQATGIRVVRVDGQPVTFGFALLREIVVKTIIFGYLAVFTLYIATVLNYLWPLWDAQNRALHDRMVGTLVRRI